MRIFAAKTGKSGDPATPNGNPRSKPQPTFRLKRAGLEPGPAFTAVGLRLADRGCFLAQCRPPSGSFASFAACPGCR